MNQPVVPAESRLRVRLAHIAPAPPRAEEFEQRFRLRIVSALFGMSEAMLFPPDTGRKPIPGVIGPAPRDWDIALVDDIGRPVPNGEVGELVARPRRPLILLDEYFDCPDDTMKSWRGLWYHTGDICNRDLDGVYWFVGRARDVIRRSGHNVSAWEIETTISGHSDVAEVAAVPVPTELGEEELILFVRRIAGSTAC
jgi:crotonobetaine/carnitine-CoA ligase